MKTLIDSFKNNAVLPLAFVAASLGYNSYSQSLENYSNKEIDNILSSQSIQKENADIKSFQIKLKPGQIPFYIPVLICHDTVIVRDTIRYTVYLEPESDKKPDKKEKNNLIDKMLGLYRSKENEQDTLFSSRKGGYSEVNLKDIGKGALLVIGSPFIVAGGIAAGIGYGVGYGALWLGKKLLNPFKRCPCDRETGKRKRRKK